MTSAQPGFHREERRSARAVRLISFLTAVGLSAASCAPTPAPTPTLPPATAAPAATATTAPDPGSPAIHGTVFHDWNGNGALDTGEPGLPGVRVCVEVSDAVQCMDTDRSGAYAINNLPAGRWHLRLEAEGYAYLFPSGNSTLALEVQNPSVSVTARTPVDIGLGVGPLTLPFLCEEMDRVAGASAYYDVDPRPGPARAWNGETLPNDGYMATAFEVQGEVAVAASAPGTVSHISSYVDGYWVEMYCDIAVPWFPSNRTVRLNYNGLDELAVHLGDRLARGETIGFLTEEGRDAESGWLGFEFRAKYLDGYGSYVFVDPFRDTQDPTSRGMWTRDNDPACFGNPSNVRVRRQVLAQRLAFPSQLPADAIRRGWLSRLAVKVHPGSGANGPE
jgi:hypothetical protein